MIIVYFSNLFKIIWQLTHTSVRIPSNVPQAAVLFDYHEYRPHVQMIAKPIPVLSSSSIDHFVTINIHKWCQLYKNGANFIN